MRTDFLYMGPAEGRCFIYALLTKDNFSSLSSLVPWATADSDEAGSALSKCIASFGGMNWLVNDRGSHFTATVIQSLTSEHHISHHVATPYYPWANRTIEFLCKKVLRAVKAFSLQWKMPRNQWPARMEAVQRIINQSPVKRLERNNKEWLRCPMQIFNGLKPYPLQIGPMPLKLYPDMKIVAEARCKLIINIESVHGAVGQVHKEISESIDANLKDAQRVHNAQTNVLPLNISLCD